MAEEPDPPDSAQRVNIKSANRVLLVLALLAAGWTLYGTALNVNQFRALIEVFGAVKIMLPGLALLALEQRIAFDIIVGVIAGTCVFMTGRDPERLRTLFANVAGIILPLVWWVLQTTTFYMASAVVLDQSFHGHQIGR
jgi:hypothetical protein